MSIKIRKAKSVFVNSINKISTSAELEDLRILYLGRKGIIKKIFDDLKRDAGNDKSLLKEANQLKQLVTDEISHTKDIFFSREIESRLENEWIDCTLQTTPNYIGGINPVTKVERECCDIFHRLGFDLAEGSHIENEYRNFDALNIDKNHPARDAQDTFYLTKEWLLRSHTTTVQILSLEKAKGNAPIKIVSPGMVYRNETVDRTHLASFHQFEGLYVDEKNKINFSNLLWLMEYIVKELVGDKFEMRIKPKHYPYTEPSIGVDIKEIGKNQWITILGAGMVHRNVFLATGFNPEKVRGIAFGIGLSRLVSMKYGVEDMKSLYELDLRVHKNLAQIGE